MCQNSCVKISARANRNKTAGLPSLLAAYPRQVGGAGYDNMEVNLEPVLDYIKAQNYKALEHEQNAKRLTGMNKWEVRLLVPTKQVPLKTMAVYLLVGFVYISGLGFVHCCFNTLRRSVWGWDVESGWEIRYRNFGKYLSTFLETCTFLYS